MQTPMPLSTGHQFKIFAWLAILAVIALAFLAMQASAIIDGGAPPAGWSWSALLLIDLFLIVSLGRTVANYYRDSHTSITAEGATQKTLFGSKSVRWLDVNEFKMVGYTLHLPAASGHMEINTAAYAEPSEAILDRVTSYIGIASGETRGTGHEVELSDESSPLPRTKVI